MDMSSDSYEPVLDTSVLYPHPHPSLNIVSNNKQISHFNVFLRSV